MFPGHLIGVDPPIPPPRGNLRIDSGVVYWDHPPYSHALQNIMRLHCQTEHLTLDPLRSPAKKVTFLQYFG